MSASLLANMDIMWLCITHQLPTISCVTEKKHQNKQEQCNTIKFHSSWCRSCPKRTVSLNINGLWCIQHWRILTSSVMHITSVEPSKTFLSQSRERILTCSQKVSTHCTTKPVPMWPALSTHWTAADHPPHSPDLSPCVFHAFSPTRKH